MKPPAPIIHLRAAALFAALLASAVAAAQERAAAPVSAEAAEKAGPDNGGAVGAAEPSAAWSESDTRLGNHYISLLQRDPSYGQVLNLLWNLYRDKEQTDLLLDYFESAAERSGAVAKLIHAHLLRKAERWHTAAAAYEGVLELQPENRHALLALAELATRRDEDALAIGYYERLDPLLPPDGDEGLAARLARAALHRQRGETAEAVALWQALLEANPERKDLRRRLVAELLEAGETEVARSALESAAAASDPRERLEALLETMRLHEYLGDPDAAAAAAEAALSLLNFREHDYAALFARLVQIHERFERLEALWTRLESAAKASPGSEKPLHDLAEFHRISADPTAEEEVLAEMVALLPDHLDYRLRLVRVQMRNDRYEAAAATLKSVLEGQTAVPLALVLLRAEIALRDDDRALAEAFLEERLRIAEPEPDEIREILDFARANYLDSLVEGLLRRFEGETVALADGRGAPSQLARFLHERGRRAQAVETLRSYVAAADSLGDSERVERLLRAALVLRDLDEDETALELIESAILLAPDKRELLVARIDILIDGGLVETAVSELESLWEREQDLEAKAEIDQRLFSLLRGHFAEPSTAMENLDLLPGGAIRTLSEYRAMAEAVNRSMNPNDEPVPVEVLAYYDAIKEAAKASPLLERRYRAAWWAMKLQDNVECYSQLTRATEEAGGPVLEVERLLLDLAVQNERPTLMVRHLTALAELDPENEQEYRQRIAETRFELGFEDEAIRELRRLAEAPEASLGTLAALAKVYRRQGGTRKQVEVWRNAYREGNVFEKRRIVRQLAEAMVEDGDPEGALEVQLELITRERDTLQQSRQFDAQLTLARTHALLDWLLEKYLDLAQQNPFDRFYPEAVARIQLASGNDREAFESMKRARYLSEQGDRLLDELSEMAERLGDLSSAIYYRRQLLARDGNSDADHWWTLVEMLEKDLRVEEADELRVRLEGRFSRDPDTLQTLADAALARGRLAEEERILARLVSLRHWDASLRLRLALVKRDRGRDAEAAVLLEEVLEATAGSSPPPLSESALPLVRVAALPLEDRNNPGHELAPWVFAVEGYPFLGGSFQDDLAEELQRIRPEFARLPESEFHIRLRALEEGAEIAASEGRSREFATRHAGEARPLVERLWAARHGGERERFLDLLDQRPPAESDPDLFFEAYARLLAGGAEGLLAWTRMPTPDEDLRGESAAGSDESVSFWDEDAPDRVPREEIARIAAFVQIALSGERPLGDSEDFLEIVAALPPEDHVGLHYFTELRRSGDYETTRRLGEILAEGALRDDGNFLFHLSQVAEWAGRSEERVAWLDRALSGPAAVTGTRGSAHYFAALTERLALFDDDESRLAHLAARRNEADGLPLGPADLLERHILIDLAGARYGEALDRLEALVARQMAALRPLGEEAGESRSTLLRSWQRMEQMMGYYAERLGPAPEILDRFSEAMAPDLALPPEDPSVLSEYERYEIDRRLHRFEGLSPSERAAKVDTLLRLLADPENRSVLVRRLETLGYHRETIPVHRIEAELRPRDYSPLQGLFDACYEAMEPGPALEVVELLRTREFPSPPGLTNEYLNEQHARFLLQNRDLERLAALGRTPENSGSRAASASSSHLPYRDALVEGYRLRGHDEELFALLEPLRESGEIKPSQWLLGADRLAARGDPEVALEWVESLLERGAESAIERRALRRALHWHAQEGHPRPEAVVALARRALESQPISLAREAALAVHAAGRSREAASLLRILRTRGGDPAERSATATALLEVERERGASWEDLAADWELLLHQFRYAGTRYEPATADEGLPRLEAWRLANGSQLVSAVLPAATLGATDEAGKDSLATVLREALPSAPAETRWLPELILASLEDRLEAAARRLIADGDRSVAEGVLETLPAFGPEGATLCRELLDEAALPGNDWFPQQPERQISLYHRAGDRGRLLEVHARLMREARSDLFRSHGMEPWYPTLANRQRLPRALVDLGERDLAARLYDRYHRSIGRYGWIHQAFLEDYLDFLIESERYPEAETLLKAALQKSLRLDLRLLPRLYAAWGRIDEWEERTRDLDLTEGRRALVLDWVAALAEGRDMVEYSRTW